MIWHAISQFDWNDLIDLHQIVKGETPFALINDLQRVAILI